MASSVFKAMAEKAGPAVRKQALTLTDAAASKVSHLLGLRQRSFLRLGVKARGCNGLSYTLNYAGMPMPTLINLMRQKYSCFLGFKLMTRHVYYYMVHTSCHYLIGLSIVNIIG